MLRIRLAVQRSNRQLVLLLVFALVLLFSGIAEFHRRQMELPEWGGPSIAILGNIVGIVIHLFPGAVLNSLPALATLAAIPWLASRFIHACYDTKDIKEARSFLERNVFGMSGLRPILIVREGRIAVGAGSLSDRVGGRALMIVYNDSAVVLERGGRLTRVVGGPSFALLEPFERIWEVIDLRPQRWVFTDDAITKDGIPVSCEADVTFKIDDRVIDQDGNVQVKSPVKAQTLPVTDATIAEEMEKAGIATPLPYTDDTVFKAATAIWVRIRQPDHEEQLRKWTGRVVIGEVEGDLRNILASYRLDWLMQPPQPGQKHPREEIRELLDQKLRSKLTVGNNIGARILHVDLGKIDVRDKKISTQWIEAWQAGWEQRAVESRAEGEAELTRLQAAQVQAQAEMVLALTEAIRPLVSSAEQIPSYLLAMRFIETLWWMSYAPWMRAFLPPEAMRTLAALEKMLGRADALPGDAMSELDRLVMAGRRQV